MILILQSVQSALVMIMIWWQTEWISHHKDLSCFKRGRVAEKYSKKSGEISRSSSTTITWFKRNVSSQKYPTRTNLVKTHIDESFVERPTIVTRNLEVTLELLLFWRNHRLGEVYGWNRYYKTTRCFSLVIKFRWFWWCFGKTTWLLNVNDLVAVAFNHSLCVLVPTILKIHKWQ